MFECLDVIRPFSLLMDGIQSRTQSKEAFSSQIEEDENDDDDERGF